MSNWGKMGNPGKSLVGVGLNIGNILLGKHSRLVFSLIKTPKVL